MKQMIHISNGAKVWHKLKFKLATINDKLPCNRVLIIKVGLVHRLFKLPEGPNHFWWIPIVFRIWHFYYTSISLSQVYFR